MAWDSLEDHSPPGFAGAEHGSRRLQVTLDLRQEGVRAAKDAPHDPFRVLESRHCLSQIVERRSGVLVAALRAETPSPSESA